MGNWQSVLTELLDREAIRDLLARYTRAIDRCDAELLRTIYWPGASEDHGQFKGDADAYINWVIPLMKTFSQTQHFLGNTLIRFIGAKANVESYFHAYHRVPIEGKWNDVFVGGRYVDVMEKRNDEWRIAAREVPLDWVRLLPGNEDWKDNYRGAVNRLIGARQPDDIVYKIFGGRYHELLKTQLTF